jgi:predicted nucleic acid-binding protein
MARERILLDTVYIQGLLSNADQHHAAAVAAFPRVERAEEILITEAVIMEVCNALATINRKAAMQFVRGCEADPKITVVHIDAELFARSLSLYENRSDKSWSLTDCISFTVMQDRRLVLAATGDHHFEQAGFQAILIEG